MDADSRLSGLSARLCAAVITVPQTLTLRDRSCNMSVEPPTPALPPSQVAAMQVLPVFFKLFECQDKALRQLLFRHIIAGEGGAVMQGMASNTECVVFSSRRRPAVWETLCFSLRTWRSLCSLCVQT